MKSLWIAAALVLAVPAMAQTPESQAPAAKPQRICLRASEIDRSTAARDEKSLTFVMRNGDRYSGELRGGRCSGISFDGFSWVLQSDNQVCENMQTLKVLQGGPICLLGKITALPRLPPKN